MKTLAKYSLGDLPAANVGRTAWGFCIALIRLMRGPRRIQTLDAAVYQEITAARVAK